VESERRTQMEKQEGRMKCFGCKERTVLSEIQIGFLCLKCYAVKFEKEFQSALQKARAK
jgi:hypothetical protein